MATGAFRPVAALPGEVSAAVATPDQHGALPEGFGQPVPAGATRLVVADGRQAGVSHDRSLEQLVVGLCLVALPFFRRRWRRAAG
ncbi:MAG TPA: hypothetical protein VHS52_06500 [Acidimicrobiales bacterium]|nr:hypothetical protein [Acidimicrobiales bacterium]